MSQGYVIVFEDEYYHRFHPISLSRPTYDILAGSKTNFERVKYHFNDFDIFTLCRPHLSDASDIAGKGKLEDLLGRQFNKLILINGIDVFRSSDSEFVNELKNTDDSVTYVKNGILIAGVLSSKELRCLSEDVLLLYCEGRSKRIIENSKKVEHVDILTFSYIWDPMLLNPELIESDFNEYFKDKDSQDNIGDSSIYGRTEISTCEDVSADVTSVIDARGGPVIIGKGVEIKPFSYIEGPAFIGNGCRLVGGKTTGGCSLGSGCRIGGEVENTIVIANTNKYHEGFIGHAYIGEWVNLGALTTNSDLKNNYSEISVKQNGIVTKTGNTKIGCFFGDHSKTGIGITLNTGVVIGFSCNLFGAAFIMEKEIPSFALASDSLRRTFPLTNAIRTAEIVLKRRSFGFDDKHRRLFEHIFDESKMQREVWLNRKGRGFGK